jgi:phosphoketolase
MTPEELRSIDAWWRAANYLAVGQIYLLDNPLLREPLRPELNLSAALANDRVADPQGVDRPQGGGRHPH